MPRKHRPAVNWLTGLPDPNFRPDKRKGDRHSDSRTKSGFVAWDGESVTENGKHEYIMLVSSNNDILINLDEISTVQALNLLLEGGERAKMKYHVGFAFSYDVNMILRDVPRDKLAVLWAEGSMWWNGYNIHYKPRKEFAVFQGKRKIRIWDVWGFFQSSFVAALQAYGHTEFLEFVASMKERRAEFSRKDFPEILAYCKLEVAKLAEIMAQFAEYLKECDLSLTRYDGAGAVAAAFLKKYGVKQHMRESEPTIQKAAAHSYFGGRIELVRYGTTNETVYQYDIRSAYPSVIQSLPCLACGEWKRDKESAQSEHPFTVYRIEWEFGPDSVVCPFPWRDRYGAIFFPQKGKGWYWAPEVSAASAALDAGVISGSLKIKERVQYVSACEHSPFTFVPDMYETRARWKKEGIGAEKVLKLGLNSLYGKFAQRIGFQEGKPPSWHQLEWSGYVTSATRARLYQASFPVILSGDLIAYATDAIFATAPVDLPCENALGNWEDSEHSGGVFVQSGVYWCDGGRVGHTRGFAKDDLRPDAIQEAWRKRRATIDWRIRRFVGLGRSLRGDRQFRLWRTWEEESKTLSLTPLGTKRTILGSARGQPHKMLVPTLPADPHTGAVRPSAPIRLPWLSIANAFDADAARRDLVIDDESDSCYD